MTGRFAADLEVLSVEQKLFRQNNFAELFNRSSYPKAAAERFGKYETFLLVELVERLELAAFADWIELFKRASDSFFALAARFE